MPWTAGVERFGRPLSPRELEVLGAIRDGATNYQVADLIGISEQTVKNHMSSILHKLGAPDRTAAVVAAFRSGDLSIGGMAPADQADVVRACDELELRLADIATELELRLADIATELKRLRSTIFVGHVDHRARVRPT